MYTVTGCQHCSTVCHDPFPPLWRPGKSGWEGALDWDAVHADATLLITGIWYAYRLGTFSL
jgi:hypothetical protein